MHSVPDFRVWSAGNVYQEAAKLLNENKQYWAAAINAALAIEIYLKAFLSEQDRSYFFEDEGVYRVGSKVKRGHDLVELYEKILPALKEQLVNEFGKRSGEHDLLSKLDRYRDVFTKARYDFELDSRPNIDTGIVHLADILREVLYKVGCDNDPTSAKTV